MVGVVDRLYSWFRCQSCCSNEKNHQVVGGSAQNDDLPGRHFRSIVAQWIAFLRCKSGIGDDIYSWIDRFDREGKTSALIWSLVIALHVILKQEATCDNPELPFAHALCDFLANADHTRTAISSLIHPAHEPFASVHHLLTPSEWMSQLFDLPALCFAVFGIKRRCSPWGKIDMNSHVVRMVGSLLSIWDTHLFKYAVKEVFCTKLTFGYLDMPPPLLKLTVCVFSRVNHEFPYYLAAYVDTLSRKRCKECLGSLDLPSNEHLPYVITRVTYTCLNNPQTARVFGNLLLSACSASIECIQQNEITHRPFYSKNLLPLVLGKTSHSPSSLRYSRMCLLILYAFMFADFPDASKQQASGPWKMLWSLILYQSNISPYLSILIVDALWFYIPHLVAEQVELHNATTDAHPNPWIQHIWTAEKHVSRLVSIWNDLMQPPLTASSASTHLRITLARLRWILWTHDTLKHNSSLHSKPINALLQRFVCTKCCSKKKAIPICIRRQTPPILHSISAGLSSSSPYYRLAAHALLMVTAVLVDLESSKDASSIELPLDINTVDQQISEPSLPPVHEWLAIVLSFPTHTSESSQNNIDQPKTSDHVEDDTTTANNVSLVSASTPSDSLTEVITLQGTKNASPRHSGITLVPHCPHENCTPCFKDYQSNVTKERELHCSETACTSHSASGEARSFLELPDASSRLLVVPNTSLFTAVVPTSLRQCLERLSKPLSSTDCPLSSKVPSTLKDYSNSRDQETPMETYWRVRRALLTIPRIAATDYEGFSLAAPLLRLVLTLDDTSMLPDFRKLQTDSAVSLLVAHPNAAVQIPSSVAFDSNIPISLRLFALEVLQNAVKNLSCFQSGNAECSATHENRFLPVAGLFFTNLLWKLNGYIRSCPHRLRDNDSTDGIAAEERNEILSRVIVTFITMIDAAQVSLELPTLMEQLSYVFDISITSQNTYLRRSAMTLLGKYAMVIRDPRDFESTLGIQRTPWILECLRLALKNDEDRLCRDMAKSILNAIYVS